ncbi:response regulator transcription factor [Limnobacter litoralis]|uniref:DNA-binding response regulator n=1 Tax=Limnobacter litoralis TaxID=481366 RepID=A0ABQ5YU68_9BURK|nr:response regulator transcription factor [Limnobacter litoralis]GLR27340.1 DNA-binding response regulator [Limnobacter litoralis]
MRIVILEDDLSQSEMLRWVLEAAGHKCHTFGNFKIFQTALYRESFDLIVLDWVLPDSSGPSVLQWVRETLQLKVPVLFITSKMDEENIVQALEAGADDYMMKPIRRNELVARVNALLRRAYPELTAPEVFEISGLEFHPKFTTVLRYGKRVVLTQKEFDLCLLFFRNLGKPLSRSHIQESVWSKDTDLPSRTLDTHVSRVRSKLALRPENGFRLTPVYGYGYKLEETNNPVAQSSQNASRLSDQ